jgi:rare lipoprotein A
MRPKLTWRAPRAVAAFGALALGVGVSGGIAIASSPPSPPISARHATPRPAQPSLLRARLVHPNVLVGADVAFIGRARPQTAGRIVAVQAFERRRWVQVARALTGHRGLFVARFWPRSIGRVALRVRARGISLRHTTLIGRLATVYHEVIASWYGPGGTTACGEALGATTMGVANKTLPCGTMVTLRCGQRSVRVPVIDRGPYVAGRDYDLTYATRLALGAGDVAAIWASA